MCVDVLEMSRRDDGRRARAVVAVLRERREKLKMSQGLLEELTGLGKGAVHRVETWKSSLTVGQLFRMLGPLGIDDLRDLERRVKVWLGEPVTHDLEDRAVTKRRVLRPGGNLAKTDQFSYLGREIVVTTTYTSLLSEEDEAQGMLYE